MSDSVFFLDRQHRAEMEAGSDMLLMAIRPAQQGTCPATPVKPFRLPKDYTDYEGPKPDTRPRSSKQRPTSERVAEMMDAGSTPKEIAAALKCNHQKATSIMQIVRAKRTGLAERLAAPVWG
jgi:hypothetical protein